jgi:hypothetical protein
MVVHPPYGISGAVIALRIFQLDGNIEQKVIDDPANLASSAATGSHNRNLFAHMDVETDEQKKLRVVQAEVNRMKLLPASSAYVIHRLKVLNKMTQLLSVAPEVILHHYP